MGLRSNAYAEEERSVRHQVRHRECNDSDSDCEENMLSAILTYDEADARPSTQFDDPLVGDSNAK